MDGDNNYELEHSRRARVASTLEYFLGRLVVVGVAASLVTSILLVGYTLVGGFFIVIDSYPYSWAFLSLENDPVFYLSLSVVSLQVLLSAVSLLLYEFLTGFKTQRDRFVVLCCYLALGFSGGTLRIVLPQALEFVSILLP
ncbi:hypothetical protein [Haloarcula argentinensis]|uniref:Uncharacterized protein n=1 Tax=Haloarcula argentinensis TaxID=43776 RepID=A0A830FX13_HALAR|nr:hypothetical protein [Haloarcula argentinensis]GGM51073.1 hypothetical protein GCM10009006_35270 [Haloarcula argentinensis]